MKIYPFKFLDSYTKNDKEIFFGRDDETNQLYEMLKQSDIVMLYGASGTGKTSLIQCGLSKKINDYDWMPFYIRRGTDINKSLENALQKFVADNESSVSNLLDELISTGQTAQSGQNGKSGLTAKLRNVYTNYFKTIYLIFDQFEELFILGQKSEQQKFIENIKAVLSSNQPVKIIFSIREEYLGHLYEFEKAVPQLMRKKLRVEAMHFEKVKQVINGITHYEKSLVKIEKQNIDEFTSILFEKLKAKNRHVIQLPYLQVFLDKLYLNITNDKKRITETEFTVQSLEKLGNIGDVLSDFLDEQVLEIFIQLKKKYSKIEQKEIWQILSPFATLEGTKDPHTLAQLYGRLPKTSKELINEVVEELLRRRILRFSEAEEVYELMHDALAQRIAEKRSEDEIAILQARQLIKSQSSLKAEAREFFTEKQLSIIEPYIDQLDLTKEEKALIEQSRINAEKQRNAEIRRQRKIIAVVGIAAIVSIAFALFGLWQMNKAKKALGNAVNYQVLGKKKDAIQFKNQEKYTAAIGKYEELLKICRQYPQFRFDTNAVYEDINECNHLDSTSKKFYAYMDKADSLIEKKEIRNIAKAFDYYLQADSLNYPYKKKKFDAFYIKLEQAKENLQQQKIMALDAGGEYGKQITVEIDKLLKKMNHIKQPSDRPKRSGG